ncbi:MAG: hypothetical protein LLG04_06450 [Parachlamydia sp.]|nr:hypothetical protein [Parachlamydia sp.]
MIPKRKAWLIILLSILLVSGLASASMAYYHYIQKKRLSDPKFRIVAIAQMSGDGEVLKTGYLAELLGLSVDRPVSLLSFPAKKAETILRQNPLITNVHISKIKPGTLLVEYQLRKPIAFLGDYANTAIDGEGYLFPFHPFYTPKKLPEIVLGAMVGEEIGDLDSPWGYQIKGHRARLALEIYRTMSTQFADVSIRRIDVSKAHALSYGQRQLVIMLEERLMREENGRRILVIQPQILQLSSSDWRHELERYKVLRLHLATEEKSQPLPELDLQERKHLGIDLRVPYLAVFHEI